MPPRFSDARAYVEEAIQKIDSSGVGFQTTEAANVVIETVIEEYKLTADGGPVIDAPLTLMRNGAAEMARSYDPSAEVRRKERKKVAKPVLQSANTGQGDFAHLDDSFLWARVDLWSAPKPAVDWYWSGRYPGLFDDGSKPLKFNVPVPPA